MNDGKEVGAFARRVTLFTRAAFFTSGAILFLGFVRMVFFSDIAASIRSFARGADQWSNTAMLTAVIGDFLRAHVAPAVIVAAAAIIVLIALKLVNRESRPDWTPGLEPAFVSRAKAVSTALRVAAWLVLAAYLATLFTMFIPGVVNAFFSQSPGMGFTMGITTIAGSVLLAIVQGGKVFFLLIFGAYLIRALLHLSSGAETAESAGGEVAT
jgi:hypothetical protein